MFKALSHTLYLRQFVIAFALLALLTFIWARTDLFPLLHGCYGHAYDDDHYLAYCQSGRYGDFEHGAAATAVEPQLIEGARAADVLILGNSRTQYAFSTPVVEQFFRQHDWTYYVFGFGFDAQSSFPDWLFKRHGIRPKVAIVNADPFFSPWPTPLSRRMAQTSEGLLDWEYQLKRRQQSWHAEQCASDGWAARWLCGRAPTVYRSRRTGMWVSDYYRPDHHHPVAEDDSLLERLPRSRQVAETFMRDHQLRPECVILTVTPQQSTPVRFARSLATQLGTPFVYPQLDELYTIDKEHLDPPSAERFAEAFLAAAEPYIRDCLASVH